MSHRDTDQPRVDRDLRDQLVRENGLTPYYINDAERQDREAAREWLNESAFDWTLPEHEIQLAHEGSGGGGHWGGSMPVRIHTFDGECNGYRSGNYLHYTIAIRPHSPSRWMRRKNRAAKVAGMYPFAPTQCIVVCSGDGNCAM